MSEREGRCGLRGSDLEFCGDVFSLKCTGDICVRLVSSWQMTIVSKVPILMSEQVVADQKGNKYIK